MTMAKMTDDREISESLPAAYHFGSLPFENGEDKNFNRYQFQRDCLSCHQMGNPFTPRVTHAGILGGDHRTHASHGWQLRRRIA
jgi:hypothetical protein